MQLNRKRTTERSLQERRNKKAYNETTKRKRKHQSFILVTPKQKMKINNGKVTEN